MECCVCVYIWDVYRAGTSIHRGLVEGLTHGEGDMGGTDAGGRLDGQTLVLLGDFHGRAGGRSHCNLPQEHIHTCSQTNTIKVKQLKLSPSVLHGLTFHAAGLSSFSAS